eukprot:TRINITY_DN3951_c0_g1_i1.p1 TRINITY_DN3951_c0_g1~~TRINITY_DN3951_c0_g1_i1.p1  ORF type:complete len:302 (+),score=72.18 TRINITY_DN3951_c0_g1_i1:45-908(+)
MSEDMAERMKKRMEERAANAATQKKEGGDKLPELVEAFDTKFHVEMKGQLEDKLKSSDSEAALAIYREMQSYLHEGCNFLPQWDKQRANKTLQELLTLIDEKKNKGKKKFTFSRKKKSVSEKVAASGNDVKVDEVNVAEEKNQSRISGKSNETILIKPSASTFLSDLTNCKVLIKPIDGSVFINSCTSCTFIVAARQLRVHNTKSSSFYLHCSSEPIIEDCSEVTFAPYNWDFDDKEALFASTTLTPDNNKWNQVNDFKWLKAQQSPNWSLLENPLRFAGESGEEVK